MNNFGKYMPPFSFYLLVVFCACWLSACAAAPKNQLTLTLITTPLATPADDSIYLAGSFNNWNPADPAYKMQKIAAGQYQYIFPIQGGIAAYKFTRGSWQTVETDSAGNEVENRSINLQAATDIVVAVAGWKDQLLPESKKESTATANVLILDSAFAMPQLNRSRRIWLYLPPDYGTSTQRYPVLYMHDGQNLFDAATSFSGEWGVDEALNLLIGQGQPAAIVVGIDNGDDKRIAEYSPWENKEYGGGEGAAYISFIVETLKPFIDSRYRTMPDQAHTSLAGSSLGALISLYGALEYPNVFGRIGLFSPAFWFNPQIFDHTAHKISPAAGQRFYFIASQQESESMVPDMQQVKELMQQQGVKAENISYQYSEDGAHSEWYWQREFPKAYRWLLK